MYLKSDEFIQICYESEFDVPTIVASLETLGRGTTRPSVIRNRIANYRRRGLLPLESGNNVDKATVLRGLSTLYDSHGNVKQQWVKSDVAKEDFLAAYRTAITELASTIPAIPSVPAPVSSSLSSDLATLYISNDVHIGALMWGEESGTDWDTSTASATLRSAYDYLLASSPNSHIGIICDLGDLMEVDNDKNMTPKSGNILAADSRFPKILRVAYEALIYGIQQALTKHELVYFYNVVGNHDINAALAVREVIRLAFINEPRVIVNDSPSNIKYHQHGTTLLGFAHGDGLKMRDAGETMAHDCQSTFSSTRHRFFHFGHWHKDSVIDSRLCRSESHRNLAPLNHWAYNMGYRCSPGTMKSITYHTESGEVSRNIYNIS